MNSNKKYPAGFTLLELLIVVAIIGILASITVPLYSSYTTRAVNSAAQSDLRNLKSAMESFYTDNQGYPTM